VKRGKWPALAQLPACRLDDQIPTPVQIHATDTRRCAKREPQAHEPLPVSGQRAGLDFPLPSLANAERVPAETEPPGRNGIGLTSSRSAEGYSRRRFFDNAARLPACGTDRSHNCTVSVVVMPNGPPIRAIRFRKTRLSPSSPPPRGGAFFCSGGVDNPGVSRFFGRRLHVAFSVFSRHTAHPVRPSVAGGTTPPISRFAG
jgi:hypothetical protein